MWNLTEYRLEGQKPGQCTHTLVWLSLFGYVTSEKYIWFERLIVSQFSAFPINRLQPIHSIKSIHSLTINDQSEIHLLRNGEIYPVPNGRCIPSSWFTCSELHTLFVINILKQLLNLSRGKPHLINISPFSSTQVFFSFSFFVFFCTFENIFLLIQFHYCYFWKNNKNNNKKDNKMYENVFFMCDSRENNTYKALTQKICDLWNRFPFNWNY